MVTMRTVRPPPLTMPLTPSRAGGGPGAPRPKTRSPESKTCTLALPLTPVSPSHLRASEAAGALYLLSQTADNLCERCSSTGHSRPAPSPRRRRTAKRSSACLRALWAGSSPRTHHLLPLQPGCSSNDPPQQGLLSKTEDR